MPEQLTFETTRIEPTWPSEDCTPCRRIREAGPAALTEAELLSVVLGMPQPGQLRHIRDLLERTRGLEGLRSCSWLGLVQSLGTEKRAERLQAALELAHRYTHSTTDELPQVHAPADAAALLVPELAHLEQEQLRVLLLNTRHRVLRHVLVYQGNVNSSLVRVGELFREAVRDNCTAIIVGHNHPSGGSPEPSPEDVAVTKEIVEAGELLDCSVLDHIIVARGGRWISMRERGLGGFGAVR